VAAAALSVTLTLVSRDVFLVPCAVAIAEAKGRRGGASGSHGEREGHAEAAALARMIFDRQLAAHGFHGASSNGETEPEILGVLGAVHEGQKHVHRIPRWQTSAFVFDLDHDAAIFGPTDERYARAGAREFERVVQ
jgi:hypothetical protein